MRRIYFGLFRFFFIDGPFVDLLQFAFASFASYFVSIFALEFCPKVGLRCGGTLAVVFFFYYSLRELSSMVTTMFLIANWHRVYALSANV